jgi:hypothetical protein
MEAKTKQKHPRNRFKVVFWVLVGAWTMLAILHMVNLPLCAYEIGPAGVCP